MHKQASCWRVYLVYKNINNRHFLVKKTPKIVCFLLLDPFFKLLFQRFILLSTCLKINYIRSYRDTNVWWYYNTIMIYKHKSNLCRFILTMGTFFVTMATCSKFEKYGKILSRLKSNRTLDIPSIYTIECANSCRHGNKGHRVKVVVYGCYTVRDLFLF